MVTGCHAWPGWGLSGPQTSTVSLCLALYRRVCQAVIDMKATSMAVLLFWDGWGKGEVSHSQHVSSDCLITQTGETEHEYRRQACHVENPGKLPTLLKTSMAKELNADSLGRQTGRVSAETDRKQSWEAEKQWNGWEPSASARGEKEKEEKYKSNAIEACRIAPAISAWGGDTEKQSNIKALQEGACCHER